MPLVIKVVLLTATEAAKKTGLSRKTIWKHCDQGHFPNAKKVGQNWWIPENDLEKFFKKKEDK